MGGGGVGESITSDSTRGIGGGEGGRGRRWPRHGGGGRIDGGRAVGREKAVGRLGASREELTETLPWY